MMINYAFFLNKPKDYTAAEDNLKYFRRLLTPVQMKHQEEHPLMQGRISQYRLACLDKLYFLKHCDL